MRPFFSYYGSRWSLAKHLDPSTVIALLDEIDALRKQRADMPAND